MTILPGVGRTLRDLAARRVARGHLGLAVLAVVATGDWILSGMDPSPALVVLLTTPVSGAALLVVAWRAVRRGGGSPWAPWMMGAVAATVVLLAHGAFTFGVAGLRRLAVHGWGPLVLLPALAYVFLGLRILRDTLKLWEVERLGAVMSVPAPEESRPGR